MAETMAAVYVEHTAAAATGATTVTTAIISTAVYFLTSKAVVHAVQKFIVISFNLSNLLPSPIFVLLFFINSF
jgi:hypothetical protein